MKTIITLIAFVVIATAQINTNEIISYRRELLAMTNTLVYGNPIFEIRDNTSGRWLTVSNRIPSHYFDGSPTNIVIFVKPDKQFPLVRPVVERNREGFFITFEHYKK